LAFPVTRARRRTLRDQVYAVDFRARDRKAPAAPAKAANAAMAAKAGPGR
jgi:hypothetical protein